MLLEQTLIKEWRPPHNILLRDDKSYPSCLHSEDEVSAAVPAPWREEAQALLVPIRARERSARASTYCRRRFVRQCEDSYFQLYSGPACNTRSGAQGPAGLVSPEEYAEDAPLGDVPQ